MVGPVKMGQKKSLFYFTSKIYVVLWRFTKSSLWITSKQYLAIPKCSILNSLYWTLLESHLKNNHRKLDHLPANDDLSSIFRKRFHFSQFTFLVWMIDTWITWIYSWMNGTVVWLLGETRCESLLHLLTPIIELVEAKARLSICTDVLKYGSWKSICHWIH